MPRGPLLFAIFVAVPLVEMYILIRVGGYLGALPVTEGRTFFSRLFSFGYFAFFVGIWFISKNETTKPVPERVQ